MAINVGDTVFDRAGKPGVVIDRDAKTANLTVQRKGEAFEKTRTRGFINGLSPQDRESFNRILDEVREMKDPRERVTALSEQVTKLREDPRQHVLTRYLEGEMAHIMNSEGIQPREYKVAESAIR